MLRLMTFNANGIRSADKKGFWTWFDAQSTDILCVQELKAQEADISEAMKKRPGYHAYFHCAVKKGYSGCGVWSKVEPRHVQIGFGIPEFDDEGRYVRLDFEHTSVIGVYFPSGTSGDDRQAANYRFLAAFEAHVEELRNSGREIVFVGDVNIAHKEIDLKNWKGNLDHTGFLPEERAWMTHLFDDLGWCDVFRRLDPRPDQYTWWSQRGQARAKNVGWRIDYQIATPQLAEKAVATSIYTGEKFSDHAPLTVDYDWSL